MKNIILMLMLLLFVTACTEEEIVIKEVEVEVPTLPAINPEIDSIYEAIADSKWNLQMFLIAKNLGGDPIVIDQYGTNIPNCDRLNGLTPDKDMVKSYTFKYDTINQILRGAKRYFCNTEKIDSVTWQVELSEIKDSEEYIKHNFIIFEKNKSDNSTHVLDAEKFTNITSDVLNKPDFFELNIKYSSEAGMLNVTTYRTQLLKQ